MFFQPSSLSRTTKTKYQIDDLCKQLNIDRDIFVGGTGGSTSEVYFGNYVEFRGCMRVIQFNGIDIVNAAKSLMSQSATAAYGVDWHCSSGEFSAASDRAIR